MTNRRATISITVFAATIALAAACQHPAPPATSPLPMIPAPQLSEPTLVPVPASQMQMTGTDTAHEIHVDIDTHGREVDVRSLLDFLAQQGKFTLVYPSGLDRRVRAQMVNVPISVALETLLAAAQLTVETTTPGAKLPTVPGVVFYELPVNVDSMSAEAMMKRFGISRPVADMIVQSRPSKTP
jgi:hypothetical protein